MNYDFKRFGELLFDKRKMKQRLPSPIYDRFIDALNHNKPLTIDVADVIAHNMKIWALEHGCTHYTHWFHPLRGSTAEKHNSFIEEHDGEPIVRFTGKSLIKDEPDASSFPNGGLRATFEARGYTYWDCESPAFIRGHVLYIPTVFISYNGESLDTKGPLLKSIDSLNKSSVNLLHKLNYKNVKSVKPCIGLEQEYFLIDRDLFLKRRDLYLTGKTLLGLLPPKGQQLEKHYFGSIPTRVNSYLEEVNSELWNLGIYAKAEHNEVAPGQFELAPIFNDSNIAIDQNMIIMEVLMDVAIKHNLVCLLHEKPYQGVNGSGKHNNYSLITNEGNNLFDPGKDLKNNIPFLVFVTSLIKAVDTHSELFRLFSSNPGNDFRLGANEAPPAIISIYLSSEIESILEGKENDKSISNTYEMTTISNLPKDSSDRNRTSPIAFTGNKFEFRTLGSSMNASELNIIINLALSEALDTFNSLLEESKNIDINEAALTICQKIYHDHKRIIFSGNGYASEWIEESKRRGLPNIKTFVESIAYFEKEESIQLFKKYNVLSQKEILAREDIKYENYYNIRVIEYKTMTEMIYQQVIPSAIKELNFICQCGEKFMSKSMMTKVAKLQAFIDEASLLAGKIEDELASINQISSLKQKCLLLLEKVNPINDSLRLIADKLEKYISKDFQPFPQYEQLFFGIDY